MSNNKSSRRSFVKAAAGGAAGLAIGSRALSAPPTAVINITFEGLMVFHKYQGDYEVGIVDKSIAKHHEMKINVPQELLTAVNSPEFLSSRIWLIDVQKNNTLKKDVKKIKEGRRKRLQDEKTYQFDFDWIAD